MTYSFLIAIVKIGGESIQNNAWQLLKELGTIGWIAIKIVGCSIMAALIAGGVLMLDKSENPFLKSLATIIIIGMFAFLVLIYYAESQSPFKTREKVHKIA